MGSEYHLIQAAHILDLQSVVLGWVSDGWIPCGGPVTDGQYWYQAIWKEAQSSDE